MLPVVCASLRLTTSSNIYPGQHTALPSLPVCWTCPSSCHPSLQHGLLTGNQPFIRGWQIMSAGVCFIPRFTLYLSCRYCCCCSPWVSDEGQTYEGGISGRPDAEAHGAYTSCGLGCLALLDAPHRIFPKYVLASRLALPTTVPLLMLSLLMCIWSTEDLTSKQRIY